MIVIIVLYILDEDIVIKKGENLGQGIIIKFDKTEDDYVIKTRESGWGSTGV